MPQEYIANQFDLVQRVREDLKEEDVSIETYRISNI